jgi:hypothetical protein
VKLINRGWGGGGASVIESRMKTDSPYLNVQWWINVGPMCDSSYDFSALIPIEGPLGLPDGVVMQGDPCVQWRRRE